MLSIAAKEKIAPIKQPLIGLAQFVPPDTHNLKVRHSIIKTMES